MSGISHCGNCDVYYTEPEAFWTALDKSCDEKGHYSALIRCRCGKRRITGGEAFADDLNDGKTAINMFGRYIRDDTDTTELDYFDAVILTECDKDDPESVGGCWHSFGYCLAPGSTGRSISLKPGNPSYIFRNLPCNCENDDVCGIRWVVSGKYQGRSGILEWCKSKYDAENIVNLINTHIHYEASPDNDHAKVEMFGIDRKYTDSFGEKRMHTEIASDRIRYAMGDIVAGYFVIEEGSSEKVYVYGKVIEVIVSDSLVNIITVRATNLMAKRDGRTGFWKRPTFIFRETHGCDYFNIIIKRSKVKYRLFNNFRDNHYLVNSQYLRNLPFRITPRLYKDDLLELFYEQYPARKDGSINKKLFKRWIRRNWNKDIVK